MNLPLSLLFGCRLAYVSAFVSLVNMTCLSNVMYRFRWLLLTDVCYIFMSHSDRTGSLARPAYTIQLYDYTT